MMVMRSAPPCRGAARCPNWRKPRNSHAGKQPKHDRPGDTIAALYFGEVMHARLKPIGHRFSYRVMSLLIDLDRLDVADRQSRLFGVNRADGELALAVYEVRNTFGDIHAYVLPVRPGELTEAGLRQQQDKLFYVSPFIDMPMRYHFRLSPAASVTLRILEADRSGPLLAATFHGRRRALTSAQLLHSFFALPLVTLKIVVAIHWEAPRLWAKGARLVPRPASARALTSIPAAIPAWRAANTPFILGQSCKPEEERSGPVTVDARQSTVRAAPWIQSHIDRWICHAGVDLRIP